MILGEGVGVGVGVGDGVGVGLGVGLGVGVGATKKNTICYRISKAEYIYSIYLA